MTKPVGRDSSTANVSARADFDAIILGAGFSGLYMLRKLRDELGLSARLFDKAGGVGGTWYWNRYPGALSDTETFTYCYSFDKDLLQDWEWNTRYVRQPQILSYLEHVAERFDLMRDIQLNTGVTAAHFDEQACLWRVSTDTGEVFTARYLISALGLLSATNVPEIKGRETFQGHQYHTAAWPADADLKGKRVGVIGTGSTGNQVITAIAPEVARLTVFQRTPQYSVPAGNGPVSPEYVAETKKNYDRIWEGVRNSIVGFGFEESTIPTMSVSETEREAIFEKGWNTGGGFYYMFGTFCDVGTDLDANEAAAAFIRKKISQIVKDPETAKKLTPQGLYAKRPLCDTGYYETFNRDNVELVDVKANPISEITARGVRTADGAEHELDVLIYATGFDAIDGNYTRIDMRGRAGVTIQSHWKGQPKSYLGVATAGFPNMFMILGPNGPFANLPPTGESQVDYVANLIIHAEKTNSGTVETTEEAETNWTATCKEIADQTVFPKGESWIFGANIPGKANTVMFYMGGLGSYRQVLKEASDSGYRGFRFRQYPSLAPQPAE